jgi:hypothetical protein
MNTSAEVHNTDVVVRVYSDTPVVTGLASISSRFHDQDVSAQHRYTKVYFKRVVSRVVTAQANQISTLNISSSLSSSSRAKGRIE